MFDYKNKLLSFEPTMRTNTIIITQIITVVKT